jgi:hypothetical protein
LVRSNGLLAVGRHLGWMPAGRMAVRAVIRRCGATGVAGLRYMRTGWWSVGPAVARRRRRRRTIIITRVGAAARWWAMRPAITRWRWWRSIRRGSLGKGWGGGVAVRAALRMFVMLWWFCANIVTGGIRLGKAGRCSECGEDKGEGKLLHVNLFLVENREGTIALKCGSCQRFKPVNLYGYWAVGASCAS